MLQQNEAIIFLGEKRVVFQSESFRSLSTLPNDDYQKLGGILKFSENTLAARANVMALAQECQYLLVLPLVGTLEIFYNQSQTFVQAGQIVCFGLPPQTQVCIENPYENELVNYLEIWIKPKEVFDKFLVYLSDFEIINTKNVLQEIIIPYLSERFLIGKFDGRSEAIFETKPPETVFSYVINGAFEIQNCLVEAQSALALWPKNNVEFEALANENILLMVVY